METTESHAETTESYGVKKKANQRTTSSFWKNKVSAYRIGLY